MIQDYYNILLLVTAPLLGFFLHKAVYHHVAFRKTLPAPHADVNYLHPAVWEEEAVQAEDSPPVVESPLVVESPPVEQLVEPPLVEAALPQPPSLYEPGSSSLIPVIESNDQYSPTPTIAFMHSGAHSNLWALYTAIFLLIVTVSLSTVLLFVRPRLAKRARAAASSAAAPAQQCSCITGIPVVLEGYEHISMMLPSYLIPTVFATSLTVGLSVTLRMEKTVSESRSWLIGGEEYAGMELETLNPAVFKAWTSRGPIQTTPLLITLPGYPLPSSTSHSDSWIQNIRILNCEGSGELEAWQSSLSHRDRVSEFSMELQSTFDASSRSIDISSDYEAVDLFGTECWTSPFATAHDVFGPVVTMPCQNKEDVLLHDDAGDSSIDSSGSDYAPYGLGAKYIPSVSINLHNWTDDEVIATSASDTSNDEGQSLLVDLPAPYYPAPEGASFEVPMFPLAMSETIEAAKERLEWRSFRRVSSQGPTGFSPSSSCAAAARQIFTAKPAVTTCSEGVPVGTSSSHLTPAVPPTHLSASPSSSFADCILEFGKERKEWNSFADATFPQGTGFSPTSSCSVAARRLFPQREEQSDPLSPSNSSMEMCPSSSYARLREFIEERPDSEARRTMLSARLTRRTPASSTSSAAHRSFPKPIDSEVHADGSKTDKKGDKENTRPTVRSSRRRL
ncbi:hypothetical protein C8Q75DRAFT_808296 [Abortiporus biennis]|nr:hypothetical protein C8Q75DRAFT_808296 [Abortiporus biennis]